ncbi:hypothetical protein Q5H92_10030 [Hymenobacter sp. M29]|uniref:Lipoprotein n=1 Tax=Hymenobacter mellowenesis TaxID=3063995 RepID=A0ABT9AC05_9BACT|nr:hypothetical protein [Hymenobacter sp. M29]MDO7846695.1 hypothetical protein [Hymenobacter sp. M29]
MFRFRFFAALLGGLALAACSKDNASPDGTPRCSRYVAGDVAIGPQAATEAAQVFQLANSQGFSISKMHGFTYVSGLPADSLAYVKRVLLNKPYLNAQGFTGGNASVYAGDRKIHVVDSQFDMTPANQADWLQTLQTLQLTDEAGARCQSCKSVMLKVPTGSEQHWVTELAKNPLLRWAELNCYSQIVLH